MPLGNALCRLVARIVEPERICVVSLPLDDVARFGGRNLANHSRIITASGRAGFVVKENNIPVPSVAGQLDWALEKKLTVGSRGGGFVPGTHKYLGIVAQVITQLAMLEGFVLTSQLFR